MSELIRILKEKIEHLVDMDRGADNGAMTQIRAEQIDLYEKIIKELSASQAREAELREKLEAAEARIAEWQQGENEDLTAARRENAELRKLLEESNADATRYRFLRRAWAEPAVLNALNESNPEPTSDAEFDAAIDTAMLSAQPKEPKQ